MAAAIDVRGVELRIDDERELWTPPGGTARVEPNARGALDVVFKHELRASRREVVLMLSTGDVPVALEVP